MRVIIFILLAMIVFVSCDPAQSFRIRNSSNRVRHIEVFLDKHAYFPYNDKIEIVSKRSYEESVVKDTANRSYRFVLPENSYAIIRQGMSIRVPDKVIVDQKDTILLDQSAMGDKASKTTLVAIEFN